MAPSPATPLDSANAATQGASKRIDRQAANTNPLHEPQEGSGSDVESNLEESTTIGVLLLDTMCPSCSYPNLHRIPSIEPGTHKQNMLKCEQCGIDYRSIERSEKKPTITSAKSFALKSERGGRRNKEDKRFSRYRPIEREALGPADPLDSVFSNDASGQLPASRTVDAAENVLWSSQRSPNSLKPQDTVQKLANQEPSPRKNLPSYARLSTLRSAVSAKREPSVDTVYEPLREPSVDTVYEPLREPSVDTVYEPLRDYQVDPDSMKDVADRTYEFTQQLSSDSDGSELYKLSYSPAITGIRRAWSQEDDRKLRELRDAGKTWGEIHEVSYEDQRIRKSLIFTTRLSRNVPKAH